MYDILADYQGHITPELNTNYDYDHELGLHILTLVGLLYINDKHINTVFKVTTGRMPLQELARLLEAKLSEQ